MNYIVFDLEFNQEYKNNSKDSLNLIKESSLTNENDVIDSTTLKSKLTFEIIQIGAVKLNENFEKVSTFNSFVKPVVHKTLHPYVENITNINMDDVNKSKEFNYILKDFLKFIGNDDTVFCVWGYVDIRELINNMNFHNIPICLLPRKYIDVQLHASKKLNYPRGTMVGLKNALDKLNLDNSGDFHDAAKDAIYTSDVLRCIYNDKFKPQNCITFQKSKS